MLRDGGVSPYLRSFGPFRIRAAFPGLLKPGSGDHGLDGLACVHEAVVGRGFLIKMHEHRNDEIITYGGEGVLRHDDSTGTKLVVRPGTVMVMNAGASFWHEERTLHEDPTARILQIFVRPHALDLEPRLQFAALAPREPGVWRVVFGPEGSAAPAFVRNDVRMLDVELSAGGRTRLAVPAGWAAYLYVFDGSVRLGDLGLGRNGTALALDEREIEVTAEEASVVVAFLIREGAQATREGTLGDVMARRWFFEEGASDRA